MLVLDLVSHVLNTTLKWNRVLLRTYLLATARSPSTTNSGKEPEQTALWGPGHSTPQGCKGGICETPTPPSVRSATGESSRVRSGSILLVVQNCPISVISFRTCSSPPCAASSKSSISNAEQVSRTIFGHRPRSRLLIESSTSRVVIQQRARESIRVQNRARELGPLG